MDNKKIRVAITHGDTNGIGYELIFKVFATPEMLELCTPIIYGSPKVAAYHSKALEMDANFSIIKNAGEAEDGRVNMLPVFEEEVKVDFGQTTDEANKAAILALDRAITDYREGHYDVLVTGPIDKDNLHVEGFHFPTSARFIESCLCEGNRCLDILINDCLRVALMTDDVPLKEVSGAITKDAVIDKAASLFSTLRRDLRVANPRIAILALNPNDSNAHPALEEREAIIPAVQQLADAGISAFGPYQADSFFGQGEYTAFDGVLAMYHDQGVAPFKALAPENNIHYYAGLPVVCTSPDLGPCYDIAGKGVADEAPLRQAIFQAIDAFRNRNNYDEPMEHPLPKLYHERKDDSEKVRFSIPKKHENAIKERQK
jgi:4-hydroxythreonine-4-phosphate dehydrogenase